LADLEKNKNLDGYASSDPAGLKLRKVIRKEPATKSGAGTGEVEIEDLEIAGDGGASALLDSPKPKRAKTGNGVDLETNMKPKLTLPASSDVGGTSLNVEATKSFWHSEFDFRRYIFASFVTKYRKLFIHLIFSPCL